MTQHHKRLAQKRRNQRNGYAQIWSIIAVVLAGVLILTLFGLMDWTPQQSPVRETAPVSINDAVHSGGLTVE